MKTTPLHAQHIALGAKTGEFAGYDMPLYYGEGVIKEHEWVRQSAGLFDVSHMGACMVVGDGALDFVQTLTPSDFASLPVGHAKYTVLMNPEGGMVDDTIITRADENAFHFVLNAGCKDKDLAWIKKHLPADLELMIFDDWALIALQGPKSEQTMRDVLGLDLSDMPYMSMRAFGDKEMFISRLGYTGEDGFEISVLNKDMPALWDKLLAHEAVKPIGLAARDSLRLEMGYPLYGHDIDDTTSPVEADLRWILDKTRSNYIGAARITRELNEGASRKRIGVKLTDRGVAREGAEILDLNDNKIGIMTSGGHSPTLKESIGMGYVETALAQAGTDVFVNVRGRNIAARLEKLPFVKAGTKSNKQKDAA